MQVIKDEKNFFIEVEIVNQIVEKRGYNVSGATKEDAITKLGENLDTFTFDSSQTFPRSMASFEVKKLYDYNEAGEKQEIPLA